ncbi:MAG: TolC family protein [Proteobacteria bacterium]|nr:TolC family protein [Pseudomonadota bacterium]
MNRKGVAILPLAGALILFLFPAQIRAGEGAAENPVSHDIPSAAEPGSPSPDVLSVTIEQAVLMALENNRAVRVERLSPSITRTFEDQELATFDPVFSAGATAFGQRDEDRRGLEGDGRGGEAGAALVKKFETGATVSAGAMAGLDTGDGLPDQYAARLGVDLTQPILKGRGRAVNLASLGQARLDSLLSEYEFRGFAESLVAQVEATYWDLVLARKRVAIVEESLALAVQQSDETRHRIRVGNLAETEIAAAEAEKALRREALINARSQVESLRVRMLRLIRPQDLSTLAVREVTTGSEPTVDRPAPGPLADHVATALAMRPDVNQARLLIQRGDLEIVKTRNGLLPRMDLFVSLGKTGYADSFGGSVGDLTGQGYDISAGVTFERPLGNRDARARRERALLTREQRQEALANVRDLACQDVELAYIEVGRARLLVDATAATLRFQEEKLRAETAKFRVGKSTGLLVAQAQRDLLASRVAEVEAVTTFLKARTSLFLLEGSLLTRRGLSAPGEAPQPYP